MEQHQHSLGVSTLSLFEEDRLDEIIFVCVGSVLVVEYILKGCQCSPSKYVQALFYEHLNCDVKCI